MIIFNNRFISASATLLLILFFCACHSEASAQDTTKVKKWNFLADVYLMFPYMDGEAGIGNQITAPIDANPGDIFSKLKMAAMLYFEAKTERWAITTDFVYMRLNQDLTPGTLVQSGTLEAKQLIWEAAGLYRILPFLEVGVGGRINNISLSIDALRNGFPDPEEVTESDSRVWFDPILITRVTGDIHDKWLFQFRGDIGGFSVGSNLTWQLQVYAGYRFCKLFQLTLGYRFLSVDYDKGIDADRFMYNVNTSGPLIRFGFNF